MCWGRVTSLCRTSLAKVPEQYGEAGRYRPHGHRGRQRHTDAGHDLVPDRVLHGEGPRGCGGRTQRAQEEVMASTFNIVLTLFSGRVVIGLKEKWSQGWKMKSPTTGSRLIFRTFFFVFVRATQIWFWCLL